MAQLADAVQGFVSLLARLMIAAIFLASAIGNKIPQFAETAAYMASEGVPNPKFALFGAIGLLLIGGVSVILGSWHSPNAWEIGYGSFEPPNWFSSRTYVFASGPAKHVGALAQAKLPLDPSLGHASLGFGVVSDWNALDFGSGDTQPGWFFEGRWRSPDMRTWVDVEIEYNNGEDDFGDAESIGGIVRPLGGGSTMPYHSTKR